ncbi:UDP-2,3-diacylglucosamine diphosphatase LpxI [bacterium]|nr:UDP-2,3-diacylglucosamine diphosphatase LpxI [bacterium]
MNSKLGIIAGEGNLPFITAKQARAQGIDQIYAVAFKGQTDPSLSNYVDAIIWVGLGQLAKLIDFFTKNDVKQAVFIGKIAHNLVLSNLKLDLKMLSLAAKIKDWRTDSILGAIANEITKSGIDIIDSTTYLKHIMPEAAVLTSRNLTNQQNEDIRFGFFIAKKLAGIDIGQTVVVKKKTVLAVEAIEGTDQAVLRGGELGKKNSVVVKVSKPKQDTRFDVPVIGKKTFENLVKANIAVIAIEAGKTIFIDKEEIIKFADKNKITVVSVDAKSLDFSDFEDQYIS